MEVKKKTDKVLDALDYLGNDIKQNINSQAYLSMFESARENNPWFTEEDVRYALLQFLPWLERKNAEKFLEKYSQNMEEQNLAIVAAGNIPCVCFHDVICGLLSLCNIQVKLSSNDKVILPFLMKRMSEKFELPISFVEKVKNFDKIIATGSNNTSLYFQSYFSDYPHIIRKSRSSVAVVCNQDNTEGLQEDVFRYFGKGCRNVSLIFLPQGYELKNLSDRLKTYKFAPDFQKYKNNCDYYKAVFLMNNIKFTDAEFFTLREELNLHPPLSVINYVFYNDISEVNKFLLEQKEDLQCVVAEKAELSDKIKKTPFGSAQSPQLDDFADEVDTMAFLQSTKQH